MSTTSSRTSVAVIHCGGTISNIPLDPYDYFAYVDHAELMPIDRLVELLAPAATDVELIPMQFSAKGSTAFGPSDWLALGKRIHEVVEEHPDITGIVVLHGTASLEETAYFLDLTLKVDVPVVVTGAMRPPGTQGSDAPVNLRNAIRTAMHPGSRGLGVLVVFDEGIYAARDVTKGSTYRVDAFHGPDLGMLGRTDWDEITFFGRSSRRHAPHSAFDVRAIQAVPRVDIVAAYPGADAVPIEALVTSGTRGIVLAGMGAGFGTPEQKRALLHAIRLGVRVVLSNRTGSGRVLRTPTMRQEGFVTGDSLSPQKAMVLTMVALTRNPSTEQLQRWFSEH